MKTNSSLFFILLLLCLGLQNCTEDSTVEPEQIQFTFDFKSLDVSGGRSASTLPDGVSLLLSLENSNGDKIFDRAKMELLSTGEGYLTPPVQLKPGQYVLTDFMIVNSSSEVLFATPKAGSALSKIVTNPVPHQFHVSKNDVKNVRMEVVDVSQVAPEDFGYASFNIEVVRSLQISVFATSENAIALTSANAYLLDNEDTLQHFALGAKVNQVAFTKDPDKSYTLVVVKDGYESYTSEFIYNHFNSKPLEVVLKPALTIALQIPEFSFGNKFRFQLKGEGGEVTVNWGDGTVENHLLSNEGNGLDMTHSYASINKTYFVAVTGALKNIEDMSLLSSSKLESINTDRLTELTGFSIPDAILASAPEKLSFRFNTKLENLQLDGVTGLKMVEIPSENRLIKIELNGSKDLTTASVDDFITKIHSSAVLHNEMNGVFAFDESLFANSNVMIGPPSEESISKLRELKNVYGWEISPEP